MVNIFILLYQGNSRLVFAYIIYTFWYQYVHSWNILVELVAMSCLPLPLNLANKRSMSLSIYQSIHLSIYLYLYLHLYIYIYLSLESSNKLYLRIWNLLWLPSATASYSQQYYWEAHSCLSLSLFPFFSKSSSRTTAQHVSSNQLNLLALSRKYSYSRQYYQEASLCGVSSIIS